MIETIQAVIPYLVVFSHAILAFVFLAAIFRRSWGKSIFALIVSHRLILGFLIALGAIGGSLFYSEVVGFEACVLCWWQRVFLYPQMILFAVAYAKSDNRVFDYSLPLTLLAGIIAFYQSYVYWGGSSLIACTEAEGACSKIFVYELGYITIPAMSLTVVLYLLLLWWVNKLHEKDNHPR